MVEDWFVLSSWMKSLWYLFPFLGLNYICALSLSLSSFDTEPTMRRLEGDSEVYKLMQENRESRAVPRQSSTFRMLQAALEMDEKGEGGVLRWETRVCEQTLSCEQVMQM